MQPRRGKWKKIIRYALFYNFELNADPCRDYETVNQEFTMVISDLLMIIYIVLQVIAL